MHVFALSLIGGIAIIVGAVILVALTYALMAGGTFLAYRKTRGGTGRRREHKPERVGRVWQLDREGKRER
jgi:predicted DNA repair protein MutK